MGEIVELEFPGRPEYLALVRVLVAAVADRSPKFDEVRIDDLRLAVSEACANAIDAYAAVGTAGEPVEVRVDIEPDRIEVEVIDRAGGFDPGDIEPHPPVTKPARLQYERGLGIPLMRALTDEVEFRRVNGGTMVRLVLLVTTGYR
jgi:serine/threonine-protein kinase RsbW